MPCTAARPIWVTAAVRPPVRIASRRSSAASRPVKLGMRGGTPTKGRGGRLQGLGMALGGGDDAAGALLGIGDADEVLIDGGGEKAAQGHVVAAEDDDAALLRALGAVRLEARELLAGLGRIFVVAGEEDDEVARVLDRVVDRSDEIGGRAECRSPGRGPCSPWRSGPPRPRARRMRPSRAG